MADDIVTWRLHKKGVLLLVAGCVLVSLLTFIAGFILGGRRAPRAPVPSPTKAKQAAKPAPKTTTQAAAQPQHLALRVGLFTTEEDAKALVARLVAVKIEAAVIPMPTSSGVTIYSVEAGHYTTRADALKAARVLDEEHGLSATVVPAGQATLAPAGPKP